MGTPAPFLASGAALRVAGSTLLLSRPPTPRRGAGSIPARFVPHTCRPALRTSTPVALPSCSVLTRLIPHQLPPCCHGSCLKPGTTPAPPSRTGGDSPKPPFTCAPPSPQRGVASLAVCRARGGIACLGGRGRSPLPPSPARAQKANQLRPPTGGTSCPSGPRTGGTAIGHRHASRQPERGFPPDPLTQGRSPPLRGPPPLFACANSPRRPRSLPRPKSLPRFPLLLRNAFAFTPPLLIPGERRFPMIRKHTLPLWPRAARGEANEVRGGLSSAFFCPEKSVVFLSLCRAIPCIFAFFPRLSATGLKSRSSCPCPVSPSPEFAPCGGRASPLCRPCGSAFCSISRLSIKGHSILRRHHGIIPTRAIR